jgi:hypothetical protein
VSAAAGALAADSAGESAADVLDQLQESEAFDYLLIAVALGALYYLYTGLQIGEDVAEGTQDAARGVGDAAGDAYEGTVDVVSESIDGSQDVARAAGGVLDDSSDFVLGGSADAVRGSGDVLEDGLDFVAGGTASAIRAPGAVAQDVWSGSVDTVDGVGDALGGLI